MTPARGMLGDVKKVLSVKLTSDDQVPTDQAMMRGLRGCVRNEASEASVKSVTNAPASVKAEGALIPKCDIACGQVLTTTRFMPGDTKSRAARGVHGERTGVPLAESTRRAALGYG